MKTKSREEIREEIHKRLMNLDLTQWQIDQLTKLMEKDVIEDLKKKEVIK